MLIETVREVKERPPVIYSHPLIFQHSRVDTCVVAFYANDGLRCLGLDHIMIIAMWAILVALLVIRHILPESLLALLTYERHLHRLLQSMVLRFLVTLRTVKPLLAARRSYGYLCVEDMFAHRAGSLILAVHQFQRDKRLPSQLG